tara:strand:- start:310 stop:708 length:399 start_codon:yes stop_codon:yes gene_type:complete
MQLSDYLKAINQNKQPLMDDPTDLTAESDYVPFIVARCLSYFPDTLIMANEINRFPSVDKKMHFDFLLNIVRKGKRFSRWHKTVQPDDLQVVKDAFQFSNEKALQTLSILSPDDLNQLRYLTRKGGKHGEGH